MRKRKLVLNFPPIKKSCHENFQGTYYDGICFELCWVTLKQAYVDCCLRAKHHKSVAYIRPRTGKLKRL